MQGASGGEDFVAAQVGNAGENVWVGVNDVGEEIVGWKFAI